MFRQVVLTAGLVWALVALVGCGGSATVRVAEPQGTLHAHVGDALVLTFRVQPGVGYTWTLTGNQPADVLTLRSEEFDADNSGLVGGPGSETFAFKARRAGTVVLMFHHAFRGRPIEDRRVLVALS